MDGLYSCDRCELSFCQRCAHLTSTEARTAALKKRKMIFLCDGCRSRYDVFVQSGDAGIPEGVNVEERFREIMAGVVSELIPGLLGSVADIVTGLASDVTSKIDRLSRSLESASVFRETPKTTVQNQGGETTVSIATPTPAGWQHASVVPNHGAKVNGHQHDQGQPRLSSDACQGATTSDHGMRPVSATLRLRKPKQDRGCQNNRERKGKPMEHDAVVVDSVQRVGPTDGGSGQITLSQVSRAVGEALEGVDEDGGNGADAEFRVVERRRSKRRRMADTQQGTASSVGDMSGFTCEPRKMWFYVGRASSQTTKEAIGQYLKNKLKAGDDQLIVENLRSVGVARSYKIGIDSKYYDQVNKAEFWPSGVVFRRFRFRSGEDSRKANFPEPTVATAEI